MLIIRKGTVHDGTGKVMEADVLVKDGKISAVGPGLAADGAKEYDAAGKVVMPGFVDALNIWGCMSPVDKDLLEHSDPVTPELSAVFAFDHENMVRQGVYQFGVTCAGITPSVMNVVGGQAAVFKTHGSHVNQMLVKEGAAMIASVSAAPKKVYGPRNTAPMTKMGAFALLLQALAKAAGPKKEDAGYDAKSEALKKVLDREMPLFVNCNTGSEMAAVELALKDYDIDIVFTGAYGADEQVKRSVVVGDLTQAISGNNEKVDFDSLKKLADKGVDIAISCCGDVGASGRESLLWNAILWYKQGFSSGDVLKMITSVPARLLGVDDRVGSIEKGKDADIVIWSANPLEDYRAVAEASFINGCNVLDTGGKENAAD